MIRSRDFVAYVDAILVDYVMKSCAKALLNECSNVFGYFICHLYVYHLSKTLSKIQEAYKS